ncbi:MAG: right-handed parallel beta-helix repeat-containing protein [Candidatus Bipolaricaulia bacterium]
MLRREDMKIMRMILFGLMLAVHITTVMVGEMPAEVEVTCPQPQGCFMGIQRAIEAAPEGATIRIGPGTYYEHELVLEKNLVLEGAGAAETVIKAVDSGAAVIARNSSYPNLTLITLQGLGIIAQGSSAVLSESGGIGLEVEGQAQSQSGLQVMVQECWIYGYVGVSVRGPAQIAIQHSFIQAIEFGIRLEEQGELRTFNTKIEGGLLLPWGIGISIYEAKALLQETSIRKWLGYGLGASKDSSVTLRRSRISSNGSGAFLVANAVAEFYETEITDNVRYGIQLALPPCFTADRVVRFKGTVRGSDNEIHDNGQGDLCPSDYPWPAGFVKRP